MTAPESRLNGLIRDRLLHFFENPSKQKRPREILRAIALPDTAC